MMPSHESAPAPEVIRPDGIRTGRAGLVALGGGLGALLASSCCILPLVLFSLGASGAWVANLVALEPLKPVFVLIALGFLGYGYRLVYWPAKACAVDAAARARSRTGS